MVFFSHFTEPRPFPSKSFSVRNSSYHSTLYGIGYPQRRKINTHIYVFIGWSSQHRFNRRNMLVLFTYAGLVPSRDLFPCWLGVMCCSVHAHRLIYVAEPHPTSVRVLVPQRPHDQLRHIPRGHYGGDGARPQDAEPSDHSRRPRHRLRQLHLQRLQHGACVYLRLRLRR
jgi:hypothetical protein